tara:strand:+ start:196 stop:459 length:264 start_codon:yes stop_codon:yes gene_type:complete
MDRNIKSKIERIIKKLPDNLSQKEKIAFAKSALGLPVKNIITKPQAPKYGGKPNPSFKFYKPKDGTRTISKKYSYKPVSGGKAGSKK